jgi:hypothetical protein
MAIILSKEIENTGVTGEYWRLDSISISRMKDSNLEVLSGHFNLYKSQTDYDADKCRIPSSTVSVRLIGNVLLSYTVTQLYTALYNEVVKVNEALEGGVSDE